jgi:phosphatidate cytidylyltransferase
VSDRFASLPQRVIVAVIAIPSILWLAYEGSYPFFGLIALISVLSLFEFYKLAELKGLHPLKGIGLVFGFLVNLAFIYDRLRLDVLRHLDTLGIHPSTFSTLQFLLFVLLIFFLCNVFIELFREKGSPILNASVTIAGVVLVSLFFGTLIQTRELFPFGFPVGQFFPNAVANDLQLAQINQWGGCTIIALFASIWLCDTAAYFGGLTLGRHKLFERVSPKKTWEGAAFGFVFAVFTMIIAKNLFLEYLAMSHAIVLGIIVGVFGQVGDLVESRFKRDAGVKDSSALIPGHGGVYDRFDSLVFISPIVYLYIDFVVLS